MNAPTVKKSKSVDMPSSTKSSKSIDNVSDQKEPEKSESVSPNLGSSPSRKTIPISPAQFLENMGNEKTKSRVDWDEEDSAELKMEDFSDSPAFTIDDNDDTDKGPSGTEIEFDCEANDDDSVLPNTEHLDLTIIGKKMKIEQLSDIDISVLDTSENGEDGTLDLTVYGTKMTIHAIEVSSDDDEAFYAEFTGKENQDPEAKSEEADDDDFDYDADGKLYIPQKFEGLDIKHDFEWEECLEFTQNDGLLVVELYCTVFGASDVMYPYIDEILHKKQQSEKIKFVRMNVKKMSEIEEIQRVIVNYDKYFQSPIPSFVFIKNQEQIYRLKGTKPTEFGELIDKYAVDETVVEEEDEDDEKRMPVKYTSILQTKSMNASSKVASSPSQTAKTERRAFKEENIMNLMKKFAVDDAQSLEDISPTKLFKRQQASASTSSPLVKTF